MGGIFAKSFRLHNLPSGRREELLEKMASANPLDQAFLLYTAKYGWFDSVLLKPGYRHTAPLSFSTSK